MSAPGRTASAGALVLLLAALSTAGTAAADVAGDPDDVSESGLDDAVAGMSPEDHVFGITPEEFIEELQQEEVEGETTTVTIAADVLFDFDEATLTDDAEETLADTAERLSGASGTAEVVGHADGIGDESYNQELSEDRAEAVKQALEEELGGDAPEIEASGKGSTEPVAEETTSDGEDDAGARAQNRRVEISFDGE